VTTWTVQATVLRVVDGDTIAADLDLGWGIWRREIVGAVSRIRILGIDTPERGDDRWAEGRDTLAALLPVGLVVWCISQKLDSFGRVLGDLLYLDGRRVKDLMPQEWWA
jgi:endonuclease YncB( thermonuclease family)